MRTKQNSKTGRTRQRKNGLATERSAGAIVFHRGVQIEYLLIFSTYWEFPKGLVEPEENELEGAMREVREETGLEIQVIPGFRESLSYFYHRAEKLIQKQVVYFLGRALAREVQVSSEHTSAEWLPYDGALQALKYENSRIILAKANDFLIAGNDNEDSRD